MLHIFAARNVGEIPMQAPTFVPLPRPIVPLRQDVAVVIPDDLVEGPLESALDIEVNPTRIIDDKVTKEIDAGRQQVAGKAL